MKKHRYRVVLLTLVTALLAQTATLAAGVSVDEDLARAAQLGFDTSRTGEETVSGRDYAALLDHFVAIAAPDQSDTWGEMIPDFRDLTGPITRAEAFIVLAAAAEIAGGNYIGLQNPESVFALNEEIGEPWDDYLVRDELFDHAFLHEEVSAHGVEWGWNRYTMGYFYALGRSSAFSGERIFAYDAAGNSMHPEADLTYRDAVLSVARLFDSAPGSEITDRVLTEADEAILSQADARREAILDSESAYTAGEGGTVYYVSPDGDDRNDGTSPETAWRTLDKVNSGAAPYYQWVYDNPSFPEFLWASDEANPQAVLEPGDVVLFQRGGQWRGVLRTVDGATYSAYGEGEKPEILCSPENGAGGEKWTLVEGTTNIWKYHRTLQDCGGILLGDDTVAAKHTAFWDENRKTYIDVGQFQASYPIEYLETCPEMDVTRHLDDLCFFNDIRYENGIDYGAFGDLYLRCDAGNPGEVYDSIEFFTGNNAWNQTAVALRDGATIDNLCIRYFLGGADAQHADNATVQNCVFLWGGGFMLDYQKSDTTITYSRAGDAIMIGGHSNRAVNNYVAHAFDWGITVEGYSAEDADWEEKYCSDCVVSGNLVEDCSGGILMVDWNAWNTSLDQPMFTDMVIQDNYVMYSGGGGWAHGEDWEAGETYLSALGLYLNPGCADIVCQDNVFYETWSIGQLIRIGYFEDSDEPVITLSGNTYVQKNMGMLYQAFIRSLAEDGSMQERYDEGAYDASAQDNATRLGDKEACVLALTVALPVPSGSVSVSVSSAMQTACDAGAELWLAQYDSSGRLLAVQRVLSAAGVVLFSPLEDTRRVTLLCVDEPHWIPQTAAGKIDL